MPRAQGCLGVYLDEIAIEDWINAMRCEFVYWRSVKGCTLQKILKHEPGSSRQGNALPFTPKLAAFENPGSAAGVDGMTGWTGKDVPECVLRVESDCQPLLLSDEAHHAQARRVAFF